MNANGSVGGAPLILDGTPLSAGRVFCIGRNYVEHVRELGNRPVGAPLVFLKPASCLVPAGERLLLPGHGSDLQHEVELVLALGATGRGWDRVVGVGLGLDLTLRDVQAEAKQNGHPWEAAKAFEGSAPLAPLVSPGEVPDREHIRFECRVNGELRQRGDSGDMIFSVPALLDSLAGIWRLREGDLVFTGTPAGVGPLREGDRIDVAGEGLPGASWTVVKAPEPFD